MSEVFKSSRMFAPRPYAPSLKKGLLPVNLVQKTTIYLVPKDLTDRERLALGLAFALLGTSVSATLEQWKSYVCSYTCFLIPGILGRTPGDSYSQVHLTRATLAPVLATIQAYMDVAYADEASNTLPDGGLDGLTIHSGLPSAHAPAECKWVGAEATMKHIYGHYSLVVFLAGKTIGEDNRVAITEKRPLAVIGKASLDEHTLILNGALRLSDASHVYLHAAWSEMTSFRSQCFLEFVGYASMEVNFAQDIIYTSVHLLRFSGMGHAKLSYKLIRAYPWVVNFSPLAGSVATFLDSVRESARVPEHLQPYLKLIYGDKSSLFPRKDMEPLIACAAAEEETMSDTMTQFYRSDRYSAIVDLFMEEKQRRAPKKARAERITTIAEAEEGSDAEYEEGTNPDHGDEEDQPGSDDHEEEEEQQEGDE